MLAFLHTSAVHIPNFARIAAALEPLVPSRHVVRADLLDQALADGCVTPVTRDETQAEVQRLVADGARVVLCTCSTIGNAAEATPRVAGARVLRVDRPMAERAASFGRPILVVAASAPAMATAVTLLSEAAAQVALPLSYRELLCGAAWQLFQAGDQAAYAAAVAEQVNEHARANDVVMLAQASMAPVASLITRSELELLTSPELGVRAALSLLAPR